MSNFQKSKDFMKKGSKFLPCEHNALKIFFKHQNFVTIIFKYFFGKKI